MKILITIGTMKEKKFTRLFEIIDQLCKEGILNGSDILAQIGFDKYKTDYYKTFDIVSSEEFICNILESDIVISHCGTGTVINALKLKKKVILFPRLSKFDEHYDDHQIELAENFKLKGFCLVAYNKDELIKNICDIRNFTPSEFISNNTYINDIILSFINKY